MLFHMSIAAREPARVARFLADLWGGEALPFPPISDDGWIALAGDDRGSAIEVYPLDTVLREAEGDADAVGERSGQMSEADALTATHGAIATSLDREAVLAAFAREGWPAKYRRRGDLFGVVEGWLEARQMIEVLTPSMQAEYRANLTIGRWRQLLGMQDSRILR